MKIKEFIVLLNNLRFKDKLFIYNNDEEVWQGHVYKEQVYKYLEDTEIRSKWISEDGLCIKLVAFDKQNQKAYDEDNAKDLVTEDDKKLSELIEWLRGQKYLIDEYSTTMTTEFEKEHKWELSRNVMINKTIKKIKEMTCKKL